MPKLTIFPYDKVKYNLLMTTLEKSNHVTVKKIDRFPEVILEIFSSRSKHEKTTQALIAELKISFGDIIVSTKGLSLIEEVTQNLMTQKLTISVAESCTGGLISHLLTQVSGSSNYFMLGAVTYSNEAKIKILGVPEDIIKNFGAVHEETAKFMARCIRKKLNTHIGLATTGIAGPTGGSPEKPVGTLCVAVSWNKNLCSKRFTFDCGTREKNKIYFAYLALNLLRLEIISHRSTQHT